MAKSVVPLNDRKIRSAKSKDSVYKLFDGGGLYLEVRKSGKKIFRYKSSNKTYTIGEYPIVTLNSAREWVKVKKQEEIFGVRLGNFSFYHVALEFLEKAKSELSEKHYKTQSRRLELYIYPVLKDKDITKIRKSDIVDVLKYTKKNRVFTTRESDGSELVKRVFIFLRQIFKFAYARDYVEGNVCDKIDINDFVAKKEVKHLKAITDESEFRELVGMIWALESVAPVTLLAFKYLILTALRSGNVRGLRWEWIDPKRGVITYPKEVMKNKKEFRIPITNGIKKILDSLTKRDSGLVFHSVGEPNRMLSDMVFNMILRRLGVENHTTHGFRSSFSTICYQNQHLHGFSSDIIEMQLSHETGNAVARAYKRGDFLEQRRELLEWWEGFIIAK